LSDADSKLLTIDDMQIEIGVQLKSIQEYSTARFNNQNGKGNWETKKPSVESQSEQSVYMFDNNLRLHKY